MDFSKSINESYWRNMSNEELNIFKNEIFNHYRQKDFPYYNLTKEEKVKEYDKFIAFNNDSIIDYENKIINQSMHGLGLLWSYMPHSFNVSCNDRLTPLEAFNSDTIFKKAIDKRLKYGTYISDSGIRKILKTISGVQGVSNFRPTASCAIYTIFTKEKDIVLDMSAGYGGRLLGAHKSKIKYIGIEPDERTYNGLEEIKSDFNINAELHLIGSEKYIPIKESLDFAFTSPPYFNTEKYNTDEYQSYIKFPTKELWLNGFLKESFKNVYYGLKGNKYMAVNIANVRSFNNLTDEVIRVAQEVGFKLFDEWKLALSSLKKDEKYKYEPIYIFLK